MGQVFTIEELEMIAESESFQAIKETRCSGIEQECAWDAALDYFFTFIATPADMMEPAKV